MATWSATNVKTGGSPNVKWLPYANTCSVTIAAVTTALGATDTITGPTLPANTYLIDVVVDSDQLETGGPTITLDAGYAGTGNSAKFISASTVAQAGGRVGSNVAGTLGFTATTDTPIFLTVHAAATTPKAGNVRVMIAYTADP